MPTANEKRARAARAVLVGAVCAVIGVALVLSPFVWGPRFTYNKYFVLVGLIVSMIGASIVLNGGIDWLRARRRG